MLRHAVRALVLAAAFLVFLPAEAHAAKFLFGTMSWQRDWAVTDPGHYTVDVDMGLSWSLSWQVRDSSGAIVTKPRPAQGESVLGTTVTFTGAGGFAKTVDVNLTVGTIFPTEDWFTAHGQVTVDAPASAFPLKGEIGPSSSNCCRAKGALDGNETAPYALRTIFPSLDGARRSPRYAGPQALYFPVSQPVLLTVPLDDVGGVMNHFRFATTAESGLVTPFPAGLTIDGDGLLRWNAAPSVPGRYAVQIIVESSEGASIPIDVTLNIMPATPAVAFTGNVCGQVLPLRPGLESAVTVAASSTASGDLVTITPSLLPAGSSYVPLTSGPSSSYQFRWTPILGAEATNVCFTARGNSAVSPGVCCVSFIPVVNDIVELKTTARRFADGQSDFGVADGDGAVGLVGQLLGPDQKPVFAPSGAAQTVASATSFAQWWSDAAPTVERRPFTMVLANDPLSSPRLFTYNSTNFFPIDTPCFGCPPHNPWFTLEGHTSVIYQPGAMMQFASSDDMWVFVDGKLALDLGGVHGLKSASLSLDGRGLTAGQSYPLDIFYAHRGLHTPALHVELFYANGCSPDGQPIAVPVLSNGSALGVTNPGPGAPPIDGATLLMSQADPATPDEVVFQVFEFVQDGFRVDFDFLVNPGSPTAPPDGLALVMAESQSFSTGYLLGADGPGLGYAGVPNSLAVEFDSAQTPQMHDPDGAHVSVQTRWDAPNSADHVYSIGAATRNVALCDGNPAGCAPAILIADDQWHHATVTYERKAGEALGKLRVYYAHDADHPEERERDIPLIEVPIDPVKLAQTFRTGRAYFGIMTGRSYSSASPPVPLNPADVYLRNWTIASNGPAALMSGLVGPLPLPPVPAGTTATVAIQSRDCAGTALPTSGDAERFRAALSNGSITLPAGITDNGDGTDEVSFTPAWPGTWQLAVTFNGTPIAGSPFTITATCPGTGPTASTTTVAAPPVPIAAGATGAVTLVARNACGEPLTTGGAANRLEAVLANGSAMAPTSIRDNGDGTYLVSYVPPTTGDWSLYLRLDGATVSGSPWAVQVAALPTGADCASYSDGTPCSDGDACTQRDECKSGVCVGSNPVVCPAAGECRAPASCDHATGACVSAPVADRTGCTDDGNPCTADVCQGGACTHPAGNAGTTCRPAAGACDVAEVCDGVSGQCPSDAFQPSSRMCRAPSCSGGQATPPAFCGAGPSCPPAATSSCGLFLCGEDACFSTCVDIEQCAPAALCAAGVCQRDTIPPDVTLAAVPAFTNLAALTVGATAMDDGRVLSARVLLNGTPIGGPLQPDAAGLLALPPLPLAEGNNTIVVEATDRAGNVGGASAEVVLDTRPPAVSFATPLPNQALGTPNIDVALTINDSSPTSSSVNGGAPLAAPSGTSVVSTTLVANASGVVTLTAVTRDAAGNTTTITQNVLIDLAAPDLAVDVPDGARFAALAGNLLPVTITVNALAASTLKVAGNAFPLPRGGGVVGTVVPLVEGRNTFSIDVVDELGKAAGLARSVVYDLTAPTGTIVAPQEGSFARGVLEMSVDANDALTGVASAFFQIDAGAAVAADSSDGRSWVARVDVRSLTDGAHRLAVDLADGVGNRRRLEAGFVVDDTPPGVAVDTPPSYVHGRIDLAASASDATSGIASLAIAVNGAVIASCASTARCIGSIDTATLPDGPFVVTATALDRAGNSASSADATFTAVNSAPSKFLLAPVDGSVITRATLSLSVKASAQFFARVDCSLDGIPIASSAVPVLTATVDLASVLDGPSVVTCVVEDVAGNRTAESANITLKRWTVDVEPKKLNVRTLNSNGESDVKLEVEGPNAELLVPIGVRDLALIVPGGTPVPARAGSAAPRGGEADLRFARAALVSSIQAGIAVGRIDPKKAFDLLLYSGPRLIGRDTITVTN